MFYLFGCYGIQWFLGYICSKDYQLLFAGATHAKFRSCRFPEDCTVCYGATSNYVLKVSITAVSHHRRFCKDFVQFRVDLQDIPVFFNICEIGGSVLLNMVMNRILLDSFFLEGFKVCFLGIFLALVTCSRI